MKCNQEKRKLFVSLVIFFIVLCIIGTSSYIYLNDYYHADLNSITAFSSSENIKKEVLDDGTLVYSSDGDEIGFVFYPGGKVEYVAYEPLMKECASRGITSILIKMPFNLAVFDVNAADGVQEQYPGIKKWYIGGHSLGGSMAASYLSNNLDKFNGLILLGAYSTTNLSNSYLDVLSIYGDEDKILNKDAYNKNKSNLPGNITEVVINGGNHSYFGMYGKQDGDGIPKITNEEQIIQTVEVISQFINK